MSYQPRTDLGLLVSRVIVEDHADGLVRKHLGVNGVQESDKLLVPVPLHVAADHRIIQGIKRGEQGCGTVALVVMRHGCPATALQRQTRLGAIERLDLALFVDRQHDGVGGRRDIESDNIVKPLGKSSVVGLLGATLPMGCQAVIVPDFHHR